MDNNDKDRSENRFVAVYGSLKAGFGNHRLLSDSMLLGTGTTEPEWDMIDFGAFPGLIKGNNSVNVEVYEVTPEVLTVLDRLESYPNFYNRKEVIIRLNQSNELVVAYIYYLENHEVYNDYSKVKSFRNDALIWNKK